MLVSRYFTWFVIFSFVGWIYETVVLTIKHKSWENRGFMFGPMCPIYGVGACAISGIAELFEKYKISYEWWHIFLIAFFGSIVIEYVTAWVLEELFHASWWDYSGVPLNIQGRICPPASMGFGVAGVLIVKYVYPFMKKYTAFVPMELLVIFSLVFMSVMTADLTLTVVSLKRLDRVVTEYNEMVNSHMEAWVAAMGDRLTGAENLLSEERERYSKWSLEHLTSSVGETFRSTVRRVVRFRSTSDLSRREQFDSVVQAIKRRVKNTKIHPKLRRD